MKHSRSVANETVCPDVVLLDLNYSLVANSRETMPTRQYEREIYREWLVDVLRASGARVVLVTVRTEDWRGATLERIASGLAGWQPDEAHFNDRGASAPEWKRHVLRSRLTPRFHGAKLLAIESNAAVHRIYDAERVPWVKVDPVDRWERLPTWTLAQRALFD